jgi:ADP-heptose:LPS heptosyltransferase
MLDTGKIDNKRLLFIRPGALGDSLLALPALALARQHWPGRDFTLVAREDVGQLARESLLADHVSDFRDVCWSSIFREKLPKGSAPHDPLYTLIRGSSVVAWLSDPDGIVEHNLLRLEARQIVLARGRPDPTVTEHMALTLARGLAPLGLTPPHDYVDLIRRMPDRLTTFASTGAPDRRLQAALTLDQPAVAFHSGSGGVAKRWPPQAFASLMETTIEHGYQPILISGPQDKDSTQSVIASLSHPAASQLQTISDLPLVQLNALLQYCRAYVGNDSGITHLAALAGVPTLALFGPTNPDYWAPVGRRARVLSSPTGDMSDIPGEAARDELIALLSSEL